MFRTLSSTAKHYMKLTTEAIINYSNKGTLGKNYWNFLPNKDIDKTDITKDPKSVQNILPYKALQQCMSIDHCIPFS